jgi:hypothetical protein
MGRSKGWEEAKDGKKQSNLNDLYFSLLSFASLRETLAFTVKISKIH